MFIVAILRHSIISDTDREVCFLLVPDAFMVEDLNAALRGIHTPDGIYVDAVAVSAEAADTVAEARAIAGGEYYKRYPYG